MYYRINKWIKVDRGVYESDQRTFCRIQMKHIGLYKISKDDRTNQWDVFKMDCNDERTVVDYMATFDTLKEAKTFAEDDFGIIFKLDDIDLA